MARCPQDFYPLLCTRVASGGGHLRVAALCTHASFNSLPIYINLLPFHPVTRYNLSILFCHLYLNRSQQQNKDKVELISAMSRPGPTKPVQGADGSRKPRQCPEAQTLYNQMRDVEEESKRPRRFNEALRQQERGRQNGPGYSSYLDIPRTTYRRNRSRTGSIGSAGPASTQGSDGGVEESGRKRRGCRNKPLDEAQRLRTAFVRTYVHACGECRQRKVKVGCHIYQTKP